MRAQDGVTWQQRVHHCFHEFEVRRTTLRRIPTPAPGSDFEADRQLSSIFPPYNAAWLALSMAGDHLESLHILWKANGYKFRSEADLSLLRPALLSSSRAYWLMEPENSTERVVRALKVGRRDRTEMKRAVEAAAAALQENSEPRIPPTREEELGKLGRSIDQLASELTRLGSTSGLISETIMINDVAQLTSADSPLLRAAPDMMWRTMSGTTHGWLWQKQLRGHEIFRDAYGPILVSTGDIEDYTVPLVATYLTWSGAWKLFEQRCAKRGSRAAFGIE